MKRLSRRTTVLLAAAAVGFIVTALLPEQVLFVESTADAEHDHGSGKRYSCPMLCTIRDSPGPCPVCGMEMTEIKDTGDGLPLSEYERRMIGLRTSEAEFRTLWRTLRTVGRVETDETRVRQVAAWIDGRIDKLYASYTGFVAKKGDSLFEIYSPTLYESQQSYLGALRARAEAEGNAKAVELQDRNVASTRRRLELFGLSAAQIDEIARTGVPRVHIDVPSPIAGTVIDKRVVEGQYVKEGEVLAVVADLGRLWIKL